MSISLKEFVDEVILCDGEIGEVLEEDGLKEVVNSYLTYSYYEWDELKNFPYEKVDRYTKSDEREEVITIVFKRKSDNKYFALNVGISHFGCGPGIVRLEENLVEVFPEIITKTIWNSHA